MTAALTVRSTRLTYHRGRWNRGAAGLRWQDTLLTVDGDGCGYSEHDEAGRSPDPFMLEQVDDVCLEEITARDTWPSAVLHAVVDAGRRPILLEVVDACRRIQSG